MRFNIIGKITSLETIAVGNGIHDIARLQKFYGKGKWRKLKGVAMVLLEGDIIAQAELHWYEAHGIGKKEIKIKDIID